MYHGWMRIFVVSLLFFSTSKKRNKWWRGGSVSGATKRDGRWWVGQKRVILASRNYWTAPDLNSVFKVLRKENKISQDLRISADLIDSALGCRWAFEGWKVGCITYLKIYSKIKVNIPRTEVIMRDESLIWAAKHIFLCFSWNRHGLYSLGPNKCYTIALLHDIKLGITLLYFI